jgi:hypothetical protein
VKEVLRRVFFDLFREHTESGESGFEVVVTFNAILTNEATPKTYSLFYGHDHRADNVAGAAPELKSGATTIVHVLSDVDNIPSSFDQTALIDSHRRAFANSAVSIHQFVNIVYLIYRFVDVETSIFNRSRKRPEDENVSSAAGPSSKKRTRAD